MLSNVPVVVIAVDVPCIDTLMVAAQTAAVVPCSSQFSATDPVTLYPSIWPVVAVATTYVDGPAVRVKTWWCCQNQERGR